MTADTNQAASGPLPRQRPRTSGGTVEDGTVQDGTVADGSAPDKATPGTGGKGPAGSGAGPTRPTGVAWRSGGRLAGVAAGQLVAVQVALALVVAAADAGPLALVAAVPAGLTLVLCALVRLRGRWAYEWAGTALRYAGRRHAPAIGADPADLLELVSPGARVVPTELAGAVAAVVGDGSGLTAVLELGDPTGVLAQALPGLPTPTSLVPPAGPDTPPTTVQLLLVGVPAPALRAGAGTPATSYRQLTEGRLLGHTRALLVVRVARAEGWTGEDLHRSLSSLVRRLPRRLAGVPVRPLGEAAVLRVLADLAHHEPATEIRETWSGLQIGGLAQATYRVQRWPDLRDGSARRLVTRMLSLPATATTVALTAGPAASGARRGTPVDLTVRLAAPTPAVLDTAAHALRKLVTGLGGDLRRLDGEHLDALAATLPLGGITPGPRPGTRAGTTVGPDGLDGLELSAGAAGLMLGTNRQRAPVMVRLFRPEHTRALLVGGLGAAQLVALRAMALGARVVIQTARPQRWEPFVRGASVPGEAIAVVPPGRVLDIAPGSALHPLLVMVDVGPVGADPQPGRGWQATLVLRDDVAPVDVDVAARADLLVLQPLHPHEAALLGSALGLGEAADWLTRIRPDMVGVVHRRALRWAALSVTPLEAQLVGSPTRG